MGIFVGLKANVKPEVFEAEAEPTKETHPQYDIIYGPFASADAVQKYVDAMGELACGEG